MEVVTMLACESPDVTSREFIGVTAGPVAIEQFSETISFEVDR